MATTYFIANLIDPDAIVVTRAKRATTSKAYTHMVFVQKPAEAGTPGPWRDGGWASRRDLAEKNAAKWEKQGYNAVIVEAEVVVAATHRAVSAVANA